MHRFKNPFAEKTRKILFWRMYTNANIRKILNTKTNANFKYFLSQCIVLTILLPRTREKHCHGDFIPKKLLEIS